MPAPGKAMLSCTDLHMPSDGRGIAKFIQTNCAMRNSHKLEGLAEIGIDYAYGQLCVCVCVCVCACTRPSIRPSELQHAGHY